MVAREAEKESAAYYMKVIQKLIDGAEVIWLVPKTRRSSVLNRVDLLFDHPDY